MNVAIEAAWQTNKLLALGKGLGGAVGLQVCTVQGADGRSMSFAKSLPVILHQTSFMKRMLSKDVEESQTMMPSENESNARSSPSAFLLNRADSRSCSVCNSQ